MPAFRVPGIVSSVSISSFHTHTRLCRHASGNPIDYVQQAALEGCLALGISDHCPYPDGTWGGSRMGTEDTAEYLSLVKAAKSAAPFPFFWGFECEWAPEYDSWYRDYLKGELGAEYLVYGAHWVKNGGDYWYIPEAADKKLLGRYLDITLAGLQSGLFDIFAHPDIFLAGFRVFDSDLKAASKTIIDLAVALSLPLEINGLGMTKDRVPGENGLRYPYPVREFWELAASSGARIVCNSDAHAPADVLSGAKNAYAFAQSLSITPEMPLSPKKD